MDRLERSFTRAVLPVVVAAGVSVASDGAEARSKLTRPSPVPPQTASVANCPSPIAAKGQGSFYVVEFNLASSSADQVLTPLCAHKPDERRNWASLTKFPALSLIYDAIKDKKLSPHQRIPIAAESLYEKDNRFALNWLLPAMKTGKGSMLLSEALTHASHSSNTMIENLATALARVETGNQNLSHAEAQGWFVNKMRQRLADWGMKDTNVMNVTGLPVGDRSGQYSTAHDVGRMFIQLTPYYKDFQTYANKPLTSDGVEQSIDNTPTNRAKKAIGDFGAIGKSGYVSGCSSYGGMKFDGETLKGSVAVNLCGGQSVFDVLANLKALDLSRPRPVNVARPVGGGGGVIATSFAPQ